MRFWVWWKSLFARKAASEVVVVVRPSPEQYALLCWWSERSGSPIDELMLRGGLGSIPSAERRRFAARRDHAPLLQAIGEVLESDDDDVRGVFPLPPARRVLPVLTQDENSLPSPSMWKEGHPCVFSVVKTDQTLAAWPSSVAVACVCVCWNPEQRGRPCHWEAGVAIQCPIFEPRMRS